MNRDELLVTAGKIRQVSESTYQEYFQKGDLLTGKMNVLMLNRSDLAHLIGENNVEMMKDNHANHVRFIASILKNYNAEVLTDTVLWVFRAYRSHGFSTNYWAAQLNAWIVIMKETLSTEAFHEVYPVYEWMQVHIPVFVKLSDEDLSTSKSLH